MLVTLTAIDEDEKTFKICRDPDTIIGLEEDEPGKTIVVFGDVTYLVKADFKILSYLANGFSVTTLQ